MLGFPTRGVVRVMALFYLPMFVFSMFG
ncbi:unnamed protein product [Tuber melanosporum]|uniref:(Perigord truffle) hypothetical protein n=1 Tax=Tuber melanosporum (strain Mel28) TaxID=656061 RepID=D5GDM6_TUBMM|nr:unnamed protein product [Tuber melanosporum]